MDWITRDEILDLLDKSPRTLRRYVQSGKVEKGILNDEVMYKLVGDNFLDIGKSYVRDKERDLYITFISSDSKPIVVPGSVHRDMKADYSNWDGSPKTMAEMALEYGMTKKVFDRYKRAHGWTHDSEPVTREDLEQRDLDEVAEEIWQNSVKELSFKLSKIQFKAIKDASEKWYGFKELVQKDLDKHLSTLKFPSTIKIETPEYWNDGSRPAVVVSLTDLHFGKYSWDQESGTSYDRKICRDRVFECLSNLLSRLPSKPDHFLLPVGSDFFHVDGDYLATTKGTSQDCDGTPAQIFVEGCSLMVEVIEVLASIAPVELILMSGNHDQSNSISLLMYLKAWYKDSTQVNIQEGFGPRNYTCFGTSLLVFSHGNDTKAKDLPLVIASENPILWGTYEHRIVFSGDKHFERVIDLGGMLVYQMPSLSGSDRWHTRHGYVGSKVSLQAYCIDLIDGPIMTITIPAKV